MHGHNLLIQYIKNNNFNLKDKVLIEIGCTRELHLDQNSTQSFAKFCNKNGMIFITVDMDPENIKNIQRFININDTFNSINMKGEDFLKNYKGKIDFIYLDAFDFNHGNHSEKRKKKYIKYLNCNITNENCYNMHLDCAKSIVNILSDDGIICFDDVYDKETFEGKGKLAIPYLLKNNFQINLYEPHAVIISRKNK